ncbi:tetratricopeptide repeat protein [Pyxidicoccus trucidator]|uniref:serine/threonine-protein kinase n=1 Tax=Pyxidicoccus trucidator TaxID=2709662 RepID=UPI0013DCBFD9|nr:serine/threonine-protein kinase [Pyxidicoccus trucidator]
MSDEARGGRGQPPPPEEADASAPTFVPLPSSGGAATATWSSSSARQAAHPMPEPGHVLAGRYTVLEQVGQGGMGMVLAAYDSRLDRRVALKLLRYRSSSPGATAGEARLVREAQAMARLSHPNVVAAYDAGALEDGSVFLAMEYVEGQTLRGWQESQPRAWRELLAAYVAAGRGLAAAHTAGLVHRDFKPDNVLMGSDGRVRVTDFGLARSGTAAPIDISPTTALPTDATLSGSLTVPGALMGTPFYMAPELLEGQPADVRSDVFAFCVALYHSLYGVSPFEGQSLSELLRSRRAGPPTPPTRSEVPAWVARAVLRGLRASPEERPASMAELLTALEDDPELRRRTWRRSLALAAGGVLLTGLAVGGWFIQRAREPGCGGQEARLAGIWDTAMKERVRQSLLGTGAPHAPDTAERVSAALDGYASRWAKQSTEVCEAARAETAGPLRLMQLRESCLERRRARLRATTEVLAGGADRAMLDRSVQAVQGLPLVEDCADVRSLTAAVPPPEDPATRAKVDTLLERVDGLDALLAAGQHKQGLPLGEVMLKEVEAVGHAPLHAQVLFLVARLRDIAGDYKGSEALTREALAVASRGREPVLMSRTLSYLAYTLSKRHSRFQEALALEPAMDALAEATGDDPVRAIAHSALGSVLMEMGRYAEARSRHEQALALRVKALGPEDPTVGDSTANLGLVSWWLGDYEDALDKTERALTLRRKVLGPKHPEVVHSLAAVGAVLKELGRTDEALEHFEHIARLQQELLGPEHPAVATALSNLSIALYDVGRYAEALETADRAMALRQKIQGPEHPDVAAILINMGIALHELGRYEEARALHERALGMWEKELGPDHALVSNALTYLGNALFKLKRYVEAEARLERALTVMEKALGKEHPELAYPLMGLGQVWLGRDRPAQARPLLERALVLAPVGARASVRLVLAQTLWELGEKERPRAVELATQAREQWQRLHHPKAAETSQWLATHGQR